MAPTLPTCRSLLYVPALRPRMLWRAAQAGADLLVVDLEDGVAPDAKAAARDALRGARADGNFAPAGPWLLRVNAPGTPWHGDDVALAAELRPAGVVLPKAEDPGEVARLAAHFAAHGADTALMIETARGVAHAVALAAAHPRVAALLYGSADYRRSIGARPDPSRGWEQLALQQILVAARAAGIAAYDGVHFLYRDLDGLRAEASVARDLGYDGKTCIHPDQLPVIHAVFAPTADEVAWARRILAAWDEDRGDERGVVVSAGEMIEALHLDIARRILARAE